MLHAADRRERPAIVAEIFVDRHGSKVRRERQVLPVDHLFRPMRIRRNIEQQVELAFLGEVGHGEMLFRLRVEDSVAQAEALRRQFALTLREAEVLVWIARGKSNRDVAEILGLSPRTVNKHLEQVFAKLGVENRASAAAAALRALP